MFVGRTITQKQNEEFFQSWISKTIDEKKKQRLREIIKKSMLVCWM